MNPEVTRSMESLYQLVPLVAPMIGGVLIKLSNGIKAEKVLTLSGKKDITNKSASEDQQTVTVNDGNHVDIFLSNGENMTIKDYPPQKNIRKNKLGKRERGGKKGGRAEVSFTGQKSFWLSKNRSHRVVNKEIIVTFMNNSNHVENENLPALMETEYRQRVPYGEQGSFAQVVQQELSANPGKLQHLAESEVRATFAQRLKADNEGWSRSDKWWEAAVDSALLGKNGSYLSVNFT